MASNLLYPANNEARVFDNNSSTTYYQLQQFARKHPQDLLQYLRVAWEREGCRDLKSPSLISELKATQVLCDGGKTGALSETFLPERELVFIHQKYMVHPEKFPFIEFPGPLTRNEIQGQWAFLELHLSVGTQDGLDFYLEMLTSIRRHSGRLMLEFPRRIWELYLRINAVCATSGDEGEARDKIRDSFQKHGLVLVSDGFWKTPSECLQKCPSSMLSKIGVLLFPSSWEASDAECAEVTQFFENTLRIQHTCSPDDCLHEVDMIRHHPAFASINRMTRYCEFMNETVPYLYVLNVRRLRLDLIRKACIAVEQDNTIQWCKPPDCVWAPGVDIPRYVDLSETYPNLESFFSGFLGVKKSGFGLAYNTRFTPYEAWALEPLMVWAGLEDRYLSWNVEETTYLEDAAPEPLNGMLTTTKARGLVRIASHFWTPRVGTSAQR
ncbi:hypothetical protein B0T10DRAFT_563031 [Thelonectria olida]|uniref:Uncharacterized protein n=1 Tax=Thelonectria olida TaxID=1576542 RepID=A0A9P8W1N9_9HYPO|nr:hypothetical protein B0T10DRAFT_563031 [Thelonectria olida]